MSQRPCGPCHACCVNMAVGELAKPENVRCEKITANGRCSCYATRPKSCQQFDCLWRMGVLPTHLRPDKTHVVPYAEGDIVVLHVTPEHRGAHRAGHFGRWLAALDPRLSVMVQCGDEREWIGPIKQQIDRGLVQIETKRRYGNSETTIHRAVGIEVPC